MDKHISMTDEETELKKQGYSLGALLGEGSYAKVRGSFSEKLQIRVAIKIINKKRAPKDFREKFLPREMEVFRKISHPNIVRLYEILEIGSKVYIVMEHAGHGDLLEFIKLRGALNYDQARTMFVQTADAVEYLHKNKIVHRDLKCENLLLDTRNVIKVSDFGFARFFEPGEKITTYCGSAAYAAPEILQGIPYDPPCHDIWAMGVILFIMVCASMPFDDSNLKQMVRDQKEGKAHFPRSKKIPALLRELIMGILEANIPKRFTIREMLNHSWVRNEVMASPSFEISPREVAKNSNRDSHMNSVKDSPRVSLRDSSRDTPRDTPRDVQKEPPKDPIRDSSKESSKDGSKDCTRDCAREYPKDFPRDSNRNRDTPKDLIKDSKNTASDIAKDA